MKRKNLKTQYEIDLLRISRNATNVCKDYKDISGKAAYNFFEKFHKELLNKSETSKGDRQYLAKILERALISGFSTFKKIESKTNPGLIFRRGTDHPKKYFDMLIINSKKQNKNILIEIKSSFGGFNGVAAALMEIVLAKHSANKIKVGKQEFKIFPRNTKFLIITGWSSVSEHQTFHHLLKILGTFPVNIFSFFPIKITQKEHWKKITSSARNFFKEQATFLN